MKIHFLFLCLATHVLYGAEVSRVFLYFTTRVDSRDFNPAKARRIITDYEQAPWLPNKLNDCILNAEQALNKYEEASCWENPLYTWAYGMGALGVVLGGTIVATAGATSPWMLAPVSFLAPVLGRFGFYQYNVNQAKNLISFMKQTQTKLQTSQMQPEKLHEHRSF